MVLQALLDVGQGEDRVSVTIVVHLPANLDYAIIVKGIKEV